jgi:hypothetical protein
MRAIRALAWVAVFVITLGMTLRVHSAYLHADGMFYFVQLRSLYFDHDIDFRNEANRYPWIRASYGQPLPAGRLANPFPIGAPILWAPFYAIADEVCRAEGASTCEGYSSPYLTSVFVATAFWTVLGCWLTTAAMGRMGAGLGVSALAVSALALASPLVFYVLQNADYSHGCSFFAASLVLYTTIRARDTPTATAFLLCGLAVGLAFLVRWQDAVLGLIPLAVALTTGPSKAMRAKAGRIALLLGGSVIAACPQFVFWNALYGRPLTIPQAGGFLSFGHIAILPFFFSTWNGALLWHPILLPAFVGLLISGKIFGRSPASAPMRWACVIVVALEVLVSMMVEDWWSGGGFGQRRLVSVLPILALGLYQTFDAVVRRGRAATLALAAIVSLLILWNALTLTRYYQGRMPFNPADSALYVSGIRYERYDYARRFSDILLGTEP